MTVHPVPPPPDLVHQLAMTIRELAQNHAAILHPTEPGGMVTEMPRRAAVQLALDVALEIAGQSPRQDHLADLLWLIRKAERINLGADPDVLDEDAEQLILMAQRYAQSQLYDEAEYLRDRQRHGE